MTTMRQASASVTAPARQAAAATRAPGVAEGYDFLARGFARGLGLEDARVVASSLGRTFTALGADGALDDDQLAAEHHRLLGRTLFPFEGFFLGQPALVGATAAALVERYRHDGFHWTAYDSADHVAAQLGYLAHLHASGRQGRAARFVDEHLGRWLPALLVALDRHGGVYAGLGALAAQLVYEIDAPQLAPEDAATETKRDAEQPASALAPDLCAADTRLGDIVDFLLTPARSGLFISGADVRALARRCEMPSSMGTRRQTLLELLENAASFDKSRAVLEALDGLLEDTGRELRELAQRHTRCTTRAWRQRLRVSRRLCAQMIATVR